MPPVAARACRTSLSGTTSRVLRPTNPAPPHLFHHLPPPPPPEGANTPRTKRLLLFPGAIQIAGPVKGRKASRHATSDWMEIEKQRGISVASSVMRSEE